MTKLRREHYEKTVKMVFDCQVCLLSLLEGIYVWSFIELGPGEIGWDYFLKKFDRRRNITKVPAKEVFKDFQDVYNQEEQDFSFVPSENTTLAKDQS